MVVRAERTGLQIARALGVCEVALTAAVVRKGAHLVVFKPVHPSEIVRQLSEAEAAN